MDLYLHPQYAFMVGATLKTQYFPTIPNISFNTVVRYIWLVAYVTILYQQQKLFNVEWRCSISVVWALGGSLQVDVGTDRGF
jgi:hypothetical protein